MWVNFRCLHMTDVEKSEIRHIWHVFDVENVAVYAKFMQFCLLFTTVYVLSCGEKLSPKVQLWRKNDKKQVCICQIFWIFVLRKTGCMSKIIHFIDFPEWFDDLEKVKKLNGYLCCTTFLDG